MRIVFISSTKSFWKFFLLLALIVGCTTFAAALPAQGAKSAAMPKLVHRDGHYALFVNGAPYLMLGAQINNSSAWPAMLPEVWPVIEDLHANTVEMPIYWEQFEPTQGHFDDSVLKVLLRQARAHHVHLVLLWFGTWKNGSGHYTPRFIKLNEKQVPHEVNAKGRKIDSLSPYSTFAMHADATAFAELMRDLKRLDPQHTVIMVQVENETGAYGTDRDYSPAAQKLFDGPVPEKLLAALHKEPGTWEQVFGTDANEYFQAWSIARYVGFVAAAGKAVNPLPMYVNAALPDPFHALYPNGYDSGGPMPMNIRIWKVAAPAIDVLAPDIYMPDYKRYTKELDLYDRPDNAMFVPETGRDDAYARYFYAALGHGVIGFSPFGMDATQYRNKPLGAKVVTAKAVAPFALNYRIFGPMDRVIAKLNFEGKVQAVSENPAEHTQTLHFGNWDAVVQYGMPVFGSWVKPKGNQPPDGGAMVAQLGPNEFLVTAVHARVDFKVADASSGLQRQFVEVQQGHYVGGQWKFERIWNGDQTDYGLNFTSGGQVLRVTLATY